MNASAVATVRSFVLNNARRSLPATPTPEVVINRVQATPYPEVLEKRVRDLSGLGKAGSEARNSPPESCGNWKDLGMRIKPGFTLDTVEQNLDRAVTGWQNLQGSHAPWDQYRGTSSGPIAF